MDINSQIEHWLTVPKETENLEFKEAKNGFDREKLYRYCVAIANERGGYLVLGLANDPPRAVVGTKAFPDLSGLKSDIRINIKLNVEIFETLRDNKRVVAVKIPSRPSGTAYEFKGSYLMRSGESLVPMTEDRLRSIFSEGQIEWGQEIIRVNLSGEQVLELIDYGTFEKFSGLPEIVDLEERLMRLSQYGLVIAKGGKFDVTRLAAITLAQDLSLFPEIERKAPRLIVYNGKDKLDTRQDITGKKGYAAELQGLVRSCMQFMPQNEIVQDALRTTVPLFPERALREVIANALIHQDFNQTGTGPIVEIFSNRIEVSNPGKPIVPVERFIDSHKSRNEKFAWLMRQLNLCEERSSGVDRVIHAAEGFQLPAPEFISGFDSTIVVIHGHRDFNKMTTDEKVRACYQHCVLRYVMREQMTNDSMRSRFGLDDRGIASVSKIIRATLDAGFICVDPTAGASKKYARYLPSWSV